MTFSIPDFFPAIPEMFLLAMACVTLLVDLFFGKRSKVITYLLAQITLITTFILCIKFYNMGPVATFSESYILDNVSVLMQMFIVAISFLVFIYSREYVLERDMPQGEFYILGLFSILGMMIVVSAYSFLTLFLGLELLSLPLYAMVAMRRDDSIASEAGMKFFILSALATGIMLYGMSIFYGVTGHLEIKQIAMAVAAVSGSKLLILIFGLVFLAVGVGFKFGAVPFHMWVPDVYEGAPTPVTAFISSAPKIAGLGLAIRIFVDATPALVLQWQHILIVLAVLSIALGNIAAISQTNIKRMLAYSSIAHMGYMTLGLIAATNKGYSAAMFYMFVYTIMSAGGFGMITLLSKGGVEVTKIQDLKGLNVRNPWLAFMMLLLMFSMAGIPPMVGFFAKVAVLEALVHVHLVWLAAYALVFAVIGSYYYINVVKVMYFDAPDEEQTSVSISREMTIAISANGLAMLALGLAPSVLFEICRAAFGV